MVGDHGELRSGETRPRRRRRKNGQWPSPTARMARLGGRRGRGGHGGALVELWFAFLRWCASSATAKLEQLELFGYARWRRRNEKWADELVGQARGGVHIVAGRASMPAARGLRVRRPATSGATRRSFSKNGQTL